MADAGERTAWGELLARTREMLMDEAGFHPGRAIRWKDEELLRFLFSGATALEQFRPSLRYQGMRLVERTFPAVEPTAEAIAEATAGLSGDAAEAAEAALRDSVVQAACAEPARIDRHYHEAVEHYAVYRALQMDENDATPAYRSNMHHKRFEELAAR